MSTARDASEIAGPAVPDQAPGVASTPVCVQDGRLLAPPSWVDVAGANRLGSGPGERYAVALGPERGYVTVSATGLFLLRAGAERRAVEAVARELSALSVDPVGPEAVVAAYRQVLEQISDSRRLVPPRRPGAWGIVRLIPPARVQWLGERLQWAFAPVPTALIWSLVALIPFAYSRRSIAAPDAATLALGYLGFVAVVLVHEFGHAAATVRGGGRPRAIGFLVYLIWPSFFTDVSDSWRLSRPARMLVDLGGVWLQLAATEVCAVLYLVTGSPALGYTIAFSVFSMGFTLNPLLKFDGYWLLTDALGVTDLMREGRLAVVGLVRRGQAPRLPYPAWQRRVLLGWALVAWTSWAVLVVWAFRSAVATAGRLPALAARLGGPEPAGALGPFLVQAFSLLVVLVAAAQLARSGIRWAARARAAR